MKPENISRNDPWTGEDFIPARTNQIFANSKNRIDYNNAKANNLRKDRSAIDRPRHRNHLILKDLMRDKDDFEVSRDFLMGAKFNFSFFTHNAMVQGKNCPCFYEYALVPNDGMKDGFRIVKSKN
jgi:hypothetical protein